MIVKDPILVIWGPLRSFKPGALAQPKYQFLKWNGYSFIVVFLICLFHQKRTLFFKKEHLGLLLSRSIAGLIAFFFIFLSLEHVSVASATLLFNTVPFFIPFLLFLWFRERIDYRLWWGITIGFIGILLILNPGASVFQWYTLLPLFSGLGGAFIFVIVGRLYHYQQPMLRIMVYSFLFSALLIMPFGIFHWTFPSLQDWGHLALAAIALFFSQTAITLGLQYAPAKILAPLCYSSVVFALLFDWAIWNEIPSWLAFAGMILVIIGGVAVILIESTANHSEIS